MLGTTDPAVDAALADPKAVAKAILEAELAMAAAVPVPEEDVEELEQDEVEEPLEREVEAEASHEAEVEPEEPVFEAEVQVEAEPEAAEPEEPAQETQEEIPVEFPPQDSRRPSAASSHSSVALAAPAGRSADQPPQPISAVTAAVRATNPILDEILHSLALIQANDPSLVMFDIHDVDCFSAQHALALANALPSNTHLRSINMHNVKLSTQAAEEIARGIAENTGVQSLDLSGNNIGPAGMRALARALETNASLTELKLDNQKSITKTGTEAEQAFSRALLKNQSLLKLSLAFRDVPSRNQVDRYIVRNKDAARKARLNSVPAK